MKLPGSVFNLVWLLAPLLLLPVFGVLLVFFMNSPWVAFVASLGLGLCGVGFIGVSKIPKFSDGNTFGIGCGAVCGKYLLFYRFGYLMVVASVVLMGICYAMTR